MVDIKRDIYGIGKPMRKRAVWGALAPTIGNMVNAAGDLTALGAAYLIAAATFGGTIAGGVASWATAKGKQDYDTAKKGYENEALAADIGYQTSRIKQERDARASEQKPKSMRAI